MVTHRIRVSPSGNWASSLLFVLQFLTSQKVPLIRLAHSYEPLGSSRPMSQEIQWTTMTQWCLCMALSIHGPFYPFSVSYNNLHRTKTTLAYEFPTPKPWYVPGASLSVTVASLGRYLCIWEFLSWSVCSTSGLRRRMSSLLAYESLYLITDHPSRNEKPVHSPSAVAKSLHTTGGYSKTGNHGDWLYNPLCNDIYIGSEMNPLAISLSNGTANYWVVSIPHVAL